jgi:predicted ATP-grasp superfamily ATP-dependent carboligase
MEAVVLNADIKSSLATIRSLARRGVRVIAGAERKTAMGLHSKYAARTFTYRSPLRDQEGFLTDVLAACAGCIEPPVLFTFSDAAFLTLARSRERFEGIAVLPLAAPESIERAFDKAASVELAESLNVPVPLTRAVTSDLEARDAFSACATVPAVMKPRHSAAWKGNRGRAGTVAFAFSAEEAASIARTMHDASGEWPIMEAYVEGGEFGYECLAKDGQIVAYSAHRRIRSMSPSGGAAVVKETIEPDARMKADAEKIIKALSWTGPAMVEFKYDESAAVYRFLEVNGRFWGSLPLAIFAGVDFPYLYYRLARGESLPAATQKTGVRSRHLLGDIRHLFRVLFDGSRMRFTYPSREKALGDFFSFDSGTRDDVYDKEDMLPSLFELIDHL